MHEVAEGRGGPPNGRTGCDSDSLYPTISFRPFIFLTEVCDLVACSTESIRSRSSVLSSKSAFCLNLRLYCYLTWHLHVSDIIAVDRVGDLTFIEAGRADLSDTCLHTRRRAWLIIDCGAGITARSALR